MARRATSLVCFFILFLFLFWKKSPKKGHFVYFSVSPFACFPPPIHSFFLCLSLSLSLSLVFFSFPCFLSCFLLLPCFLSLCFLPCFFVLVSCKDQHQNTKFQCFCYESFLCFWFPVLFCLSNRFFMSLFFSLSQVVFLVNINVFTFPKTTYKTTIFSEVGGRNKKFITCILQTVKVIIIFWPILGQMLVDVQKTVRIGILAPFYEQQKAKQYHFWVLSSGPSRCYYLGQVCCNIKMANLAHIIVPEMLARNLFKVLKKPQFIAFLTNNVKNLAQTITFKMAQLDPGNNTTIYIYIYR